MKQPSILLIGALLPHLSFVATAAEGDEHNRALQRQKDLETMAGPLSLEEQTSLKKLLDRGVIKRDSGPRARFLKKNPLKQSGQKKKRPTGVRQQGESKPPKNGQRPASSERTQRNHPKGASATQRNHPKGASDTQRNHPHGAYDTQRNHPHDGADTGEAKTHHDHPTGEAKTQRDHQTAGADTQRSHPHGASDTQRNHPYDGADTGEAKKHHDHPKGEAKTQRNHQAGGADTHRNHPNEQADTERWHDPIYTDDWNDEYFEYDDIYYNPGTGKGGGYDDDAYSGYDDDDTYYVGVLPPPLEAMYLEGFQEATNVQLVLTGDANSDEFAPGTVYLYDNEVVFAASATADSPLSGVIDTEQIAVVSGKCTRTDIADDQDPLYLGKAYCMFTYDFVDVTGVSDGQLTAEGIVCIGDISKLAITGGSAFFRKTVGEIWLYPATTETGRDFLGNAQRDIPTSYYMYAALYLDPNLLLQFY